ncbi:restriction endonuclease [Bacillus salacetis]|nr:restriction endonuclease [Bacillus salacetis]
MNKLQKEEEFKSLLEFLLTNYSEYNNIINFVEDHDYDSLLANDFAEELSKYEKDVESIFGLQLFDIDTNSLNIKFFDTIKNVVKALEVIKSLSPHDFERLCALYLHFLGSSKRPNVTRKSHDQGIDFVGAIERDLDNKILAKNMNINRVYLIGQAKHYKEDRVGSKEVRELAGSLLLLKSGNFALLQGIYKGLVENIKAFTPVYAYFITSYYFSQSAKTLCMNSDIMPVDRILLAFTFGLNHEYHNVSGNFDNDILVRKLAEIDYIR